MKILGLLGMYFDAVVVEVKTFLFLFRLALVILFNMPPTRAMSSRSFKARAPFHGSLHPYPESRIWEQYPILSLESIQRICDKCVALKEINLRKTELSEDSVTFLVNNLTTTVKKLNLEELTFLKDEHIKTLVKRCTRYVFGVIGLP